MKQNIERFVVVFQFGKVASTSLVATLNKLPNIEAVQCHFLGCGALTKMVPHMLSPETPDYFFEHQLGQFTQNTRVTRRINAINAGTCDQELVIISLARDPIEWLRSGITQDASAYLSALTKLAKHVGYSGNDDGDAIRAGLTELLKIYSRSLNEFGGIDGLQERIKNPQFDFSASSVFSEIPGNHQLFQLMLRPFFWFKDHFEITTEIGLEDLSAVDDFWHLGSEKANYLILKYETMSESFPKAIHHIGIEGSNRIERKNLSKGKPFDKEISKVFEENDLTELRSHFAKSSYSRFFGYSY